MPCVGTRRVITAGGTEKPTGRKSTPSKTRKDGAQDVTIPTGKPGNTKTDQAWIDAHAAELHPIDDDEPVPFGVKMKWDGLAANVGSEFFVPDAERRCTGRAFIRDAEGRHIVDSNNVELQRQCSRWRRVGTTVCDKHGGSAEQVLQAARRRLLAAADPAIGQLIAIANSPATEDGDRIRAITAILDRAGIRAGVDVQVSTPAWQDMLKGMYEQGTPAGVRGPGAIDSQAAEPPPRGGRAPRRPTRSSAV